MSAHAPSIDELIRDRERTDPGLGSGFVVSVSVHVVVVAALLLAPSLFKKAPPLVPIGVLIEMPAGGRGTSDPAPPAPEPKAAAVAPPVTAPPAPPVTAPPAKVVKPPKEVKKGVPELRDKPEKKVRATPPPAPPKPASTGSGRAGGVTPGATGSTPGPAGLELAPPGEGVPGGTDAHGDWYLASVQKKIWMLWVQQPKPDFVQPVTIMLTILADGSVDEVRIVQSSGVRQVDFAAQRAVATAAPFGPLPRHYGTNRYTLQAVFRPVAP